MIQAAKSIGRVTSDSKANLASNSVRNVHSINQPRSWFNEILRYAAVPMSSFSIGTIFVAGRGGITSTLVILLSLRSGAGVVGLEALFVVTVETSCWFCG